MPFFTPSEYVGAAHARATQERCAQSAPVAQANPTPQREGALPPQSVPDSPVFFTPSQWVPRTHLELVQMLSVQSTDNPHCFPSVQAGATDPPQSTSVSSPFFLPSLGEGAAHFAPVQTALMQSSAALQPLSPPHFGAAALPPQSTSVSMPSLMPFDADTFRQARCTQEVELQSLPTWQPSPTAHLVGLEPPQSTPVSSPFWTPSLAESTTTTGGGVVEGCFSVHAPSAALPKRNAIPPHAPIVLIFVAYGLRGQEQAQGAVMGPQACDTSRKSTARGVTSHYRAQRPPTA